MEDFLLFVEGLLGFFKEFIKIFSFCLYRAPVLVALALIECGMKYEDAVQFIRQ